MSIRNPPPGPISGLATLDFGTLPGSSEASIIITGQSAISSNSKVKIYINENDTSSNHTANDHKYLEDLLFSIDAVNITAGVGFTIQAYSEHKLTGTWTIRYFWFN